MLAGTLLQANAAEVIEYDTGVGKIEFDPATGTITDANLRVTGEKYPLVIPEEINGVPVTSIGTSAFQGSDYISSVSLPDSVVSAFRACDRLSEITFGKNLETIGDDAFYNTIIETLTIPDSVRSIGSGAFSECYFLTVVIIGDGLVDFDVSAFEGCRPFTVEAEPY